MNKLPAGIEVQLTRVWAFLEYLGPDADKFQCETKESGHVVVGGQIIWDAWGVPELSIDTIRDFFSRVGELPGFRDNPMVRVYRLAAEQHGTLYGGLTHSVQTANVGAAITAELLGADFADVLDFLGNDVPASVAVEAARRVIPTPAAPGTWKTFKRNVEELRPPANGK